jgi:hypothetical protein
LGQSFESDGSELPLEMKLRLDIGDKYDQYFEDPEAAGIYREMFEDILKQATVFLYLSYQMAEWQNFDDLKKYLKERNGEMLAAARKDTQEERDKTLPAVRQPNLPDRTTA